jgi:hypothetical protein
MELDSLDIDSVRPAWMTSLACSFANNLNFLKHVEVVNILTGEGIDEAISWLRKRINTPKEERLPMKEVKERDDGKRLFS